MKSWDARIHGEDYQGPTPCFRSGHGNLNARDRDIWQSIFVENEYELGELKADDVVVDIGMHIGAFSCLAFTKGSRMVFGFEVDPDAHTYAVRNAVEIGCRDAIRCCQGAVVRSDRPQTPRWYNGHWNIFETQGREVFAFSLDDIIEYDTGPVRFLKIDCEGSEWPILYTCTKLNMVQEIAGEYHTRTFDANMEQHLELTGLPPCNPAALAEFLQAQGFDTRFTSQTPDGGTGNFFARRRA